MVLIVVLCGLMISPTVKQSAAAFDKIDASSPASVPMIDERSGQSAQATAEVLPENMDEDSFSSRIIDRICRKFEFGFRLVGGTEISTIYRSPPTLIFFFSYSRTSSFSSCPSFPSGE